MGAREKIAYLKGSIDGQGIAQSPETLKFYAALTDALDSLVGEIEAHDEVHRELGEYLEMLDEDLSELEDLNDCTCPSCTGEADDDDEFEEEEYASVCCPHCNKDFYYEPAAYDEDEDLICPHCGKVFKQDTI